MAFHLKRERDGAGDHGPYSKAIAYNEDGTFKEYKGHRPLLGCSMQVGSITARSYSRQDWWLTTPITEIIEEIKITEGTQLETDYVRFKTGNSIYEWWNGTYPK